jgi:hypothetical protein
LIENICYSYKTKFLSIDHRSLKQVLNSLMSYDACVVMWPCVEAEHNHRSDNHHSWLIIIGFLWAHLERELSDYLRSSIKFLQEITWAVLRFIFLPFTLTIEFFITCVLFCFVIQFSRETWDCLGACDLRACFITALFTLWNCFAFFLTLLLSSLNN